MYLTQANLFIWHSLGKKSGAGVLWGQVTFWGQCFHSTDSSAADARATQADSVLASGRVAPPAAGAAAGILAAQCVSCPVCQGDLQTPVTSSILTPQLKRTTTKKTPSLSVCASLQLKREKKLEVVVLEAVSSCHSCLRTAETVFNWQLKGIMLPKGKKKLLC